MNIEDREYQLVSDTFRALLPKTPQVPACDIGAGVLPFTAAGGEFYDFLPLADGKLGIAIGDVAGKGFGPALLAATTLAYLRAVARMHSDIGEIVSTVNQMLIGDVQLEARFVTLLLIRLDVQNQTLTSVNAGHNAGWILNPVGTRTSLHGGPTAGLPLGVNLGSRYAVSNPVALESGDTMFLATDGLIDSTAESPDPLIEIVLANSHRRAQEQVDSLIEVVNLLSKRQSVSASDAVRPSAPRIEGLQRLLERYPNVQPPLDDLAAVIVKIDDESIPPAEPVPPTLRSGSPNPPYDDTPLCDTTPCGYSPALYESVTASQS